MTVIVDNGDVEAVCRELDAAWRQQTTFVVLADKAAVDKTWLSNAWEQFPSDLRRDHFALLTSGTTGHPKMVIGLKRRAEQLAEALHQRQQSEPVTNTVTTLPLSYSYSFVNQWLWSRHYGRVLKVTAGLADPVGFQSALRDADETMLCLVGGQVVLLQTHLPEAVFPGVIRVHFAGGRFPQERLPIVRRLFPNALIYNNYGCAEALPRLAIRDSEEAAEAEVVGWPLPGVELRTSPTGEIEFRSKFGAVATVTAEGFCRIGESWVGTGDSGHCESNGWRVAGRVGDVFKRYGEKVSLSGLLKTALECWQGQAAFFRERDSFGEEGHVLVLAPHPVGSDVRAVLTGLRSRHSRAHWPLRLESIDRIPLLPNGKADVRSLATSNGKQVHWRQHI